MRVEKHDFSKNNLQLLAWRELIENRKIPFSKFKWQYCKNPYGLTDVWLLYDKGKIIAQYTLQRQEYLYYGTRITGALAFDLAVHPDYRKRGLFIDMGFHSLKEAGNLGIQFVLGFPWEDGIALPGHKAVGWTMLGKLNIYEKEIEYLEYKEPKYIKPISTFDRRFTRLSEEYGGRNIMLNRTASYLNWRYILKPDSYYHAYKISYDDFLIGYFILKSYKEYLHIVDFLLPNDDYIFEAVIRYSMMVAPIYNKLSLIVIEGSEFCKYLKKNGFKKQEKGFEPIMYMNDPSLEINDFVNVYNYHFTMGDNDIF